MVAKWRIKVFLILLLAVLTASGCGMWPSLDVSLSPNGDGGDGLGDNMETRQGSFVPAVIPVAGEVSQLHTVYLLDYQGRYLVPYVLSVDKTEGIAREVVQHLVAVAANETAVAGTEFLLPLPPNTSVLGMTIRDGLVIIDLSQEFLQFRDATHERLAVDSLLYTLTEFDSIEAMELRVTGRVVSELPSGLPLPSPLTRADRPLNFEVAPTITDLTSGTKVCIYYSASGPAGDLLYFVPVTRQIPVTNDPMAAAVLELIEGPLSGSGLYGDVPAGTELRSIKLVGDVVHVDFSPGLLAYGGGHAAEQAMLGSLILTLTELPGVQGVKITVDGQPPLLPEGTDVSQPVARPIFVNPFVL